MRYKESSPYTMKKDHGESLVNVFNSLADRLFATIKFPLEKDEFYAAYFDSVPDDFKEVSQKMVDLYGWSEYSLHSGNFLLRVRLKDEPVSYRIQGQMRGNNPLEGQLRPQNEVVLREGSPYARALNSFCEEYMACRNRADEAKAKFLAFVKAANTSAEVFFALPLLRQYGENSKSFGWKMPKGRRPQNFVGENFPREDVEYINEVLLTMMLVKDFPIDQLTWQMSFSAKIEGLSGDLFSAQ